MPRQVPAGQTLDWSMSGDLALTKSKLLVVRTGRLQATEHAAACHATLDRRAQHMLMVNTVGIELRAEVAAHSSFALLLADLLNTSGGRRGQRFAVSHAGAVRMSMDSATSNNCSSLWPQRRRRTRRAVRPHQAVTTGDAVGETLILAPVTGAGLLACSRPAFRRGRRRGSR